MILKLNQELEDALIQSAGEPIEVEGERSHTIYVVASREHYQQSQPADVDRHKLREALIARRDESRELNAEWEHADREVWEGSSNQR